MEDQEDDATAEFEAAGAADGTSSSHRLNTSSSSSRKNSASESSKDRFFIQGASSSSSRRAGFGRGTKVVLCGDSAGGHLVIALTKQLRADAVAAAAAATNANVVASGLPFNGTADATSAPDATPASETENRAGATAIAGAKAVGGAEPVLLPAALVALSPWLQLAAPPSEEEEEGDAKKKVDILSPAMVKSFVKDLVSGRRAER